MANRNLYNIIALIVAFLVYLFFISLLVVYIKESQKRIKDYGYNVEEAIVVELDTKPSQNPTPKPKPLPTPPVKEIVKEPEPTPKQPVEEIIEPDEKPEVKPIVEPIKEEPIKSDPIVKEEIIDTQEINQKEQEARDIENRSAKDLFSTIRTKDYKEVIEERKKEDAARASRLAKQKAMRKKRERERKRRAKAVAEAKALLKSLKSSSSSHKKSGERDDFWSPITNRIMSKWNQTISTQDGLMAIVRIRIDNQGILSYRIKRLSNNSLFDTKLKVFLENLEYMKFPRYKDGPYIEATFEFKDQAK